MEFEGLNNNNKPVGTFVVVSPETYTCLWSVAALYTLQEELLELDRIVFEGVYGDSGCICTKVREDLAPQRRRRCNEILSPGTSRLVVRSDSEEMNKTSGRTVSAPRN